MSSDGLRSRTFPSKKAQVEDGDARQTKSNLAGPIKHGNLRQAALMAAFGIYFISSCIAIHVGQFLGSPLYFINKDYYYAYMSTTKQSFGLAINSITQWFSPATIRVSAEPGVADELDLSKDGRLECSFPERLVLMSNHQIYTDWLYLWWISYTNRMHGHIYIILKESLKYYPVIGPGMLFYGFIFLARNWTKDKPRFQYHLQKLNSQHSGPLSGSQLLDPMWLMIFPEGTNLSKNGRASSNKWAQKMGLRDMQHQLLPRSTGLQFCLQELRKTVEWIYDCTIAYEGIPRGEYGQDIFSLRSMYFQGRRPKSVNMYWRRFKVSEIPMDDAKAFEIWLRDRWTEKDDLIELFVQQGRFPANDAQPRSKYDGTGPIRGKPNYFETQVRQKSRFEFLLIFAHVAVFALACFVFRAFWRRIKADFGY